MSRSLEWVQIPLIPQIIMEEWQSWSIALDLKSREWETVPWVRILLPPHRELPEMADRGVLLRR